MPSAKSAHAQKEEEEVKLLETLKGLCPCSRGRSGADTTLCPVVAVNIWWWSLTDEETGAQKASV